MTSGQMRCVIHFMRSTISSLEMEIAKIELHLDEQLESKTDSCLWGCRSDDECVIVSACGLEVVEEEYRPLIGTAYCPGCGKRISHGE